MVQVIPLSACLEKVAVYPVTKCVWVGRPYGHPNFAMEKNYAFELDDEKLACVILGTMFDP